MFKKIFLFNNNNNNNNKLLNYIKLIFLLNNILYKINVIYRKKININFNINIYT